MSESIISVIPVTVFGNIEKFNQVISKGRCRLFYTGLNRNGSFISKEFADKLIQTIPYVPVKGIYNEEERDFTDHGERRDLGRIYGIVPAEPNFAWEKHLDEDGVEREYACVDVLLYTALYKEASEITGKAQSMELYGDSIKGSWKIIDGRRCYVYEDACFLGCQVLGDHTEPCFEGSAFYTLDSMKEFFDEVSTYNKKFQSNGQGGQKMPNDLFRLSDSDKARALNDLLNPNVDEEGYRIFENVILDVYDDYAISFNFASGHYERAYYIKDDATDSLEITKRERCWVYDVNEQEKTILDNVRNYNNGSFDKIDEKLAEVDGLHSRISELEQTNSSLNDEIVVMSESNQKAMEEIQHNYEEAVATATTLRAENEELVSYKKKIEDDKKLAVISEYEEYLSEEVLNNFRTNLDNYTCETLDIQLTYAQKKANPSMFQKQATPAYVPKDENVNTGINSILARYEKK